MKKRLFSLLTQTISGERIRLNAEEIHRLEGNESYSRYKASTDYVIKMLEEAGFVQIERIALPADGKTAYFDCIMPQAWETTGRSFVRLEDESMTMEERMIADSTGDSFNIGIWSAPTPEGGTDCEIADFRLTGKNRDAVRGKLVLMDGFSQDQYQFLAMNGAAGVLISDSKAEEDYPDSCRWCNAIGYTGWFLTAEDKRIPVFSITPRRCAFLRERLSKGKLTAHAEAQCRVYDGETYTVTGIIPGETGQEITMIAHMYEPFLPDDAAGGAVIAEICRCLKMLIARKQLPAFKKTLRIVLSMERYGFSHYFSDAERNRKTLTVFSFDSCCHVPGKETTDLQVRISSMLHPTFLDLYLPYLMRQELPHRRFITEKGTLSDDTFCSDDSIGIPSMWVHVFNARYHHNSGPAFMNADWDLACEVAAVMGTLIGELAAGDRAAYRSIMRKCEKLACKFMAEMCIIIQHEFSDGKLTARDAREKIRYYAEKLIKQLYSMKKFCSLEISGTVCREIRRMALGVQRKFPVSGEKCEWFGISRKAAHTIVTRLRPGTLMSLAHIPQPERHNVLIPDLLYVLLDGKRSVHEAVKLYEYETGFIFSEQQFESLMEELRYLEKYGYVKMTEK